MRTYDIAAYTSALHFGVSLAVKMLLCGVVSVPGQGCQAPSPPSPRLLRRPPPLCSFCPSSPLGVRWLSTLTLVYTVACLLLTKSLATLLHNVVVKVDQRICFEA